MRCVALLVLTLGVAATVPSRAQAPDEGITALVLRIQEAVLTGDASAYLALLAPDADRSAAELFTSSHFAPGGTRAVVQERDRVPRAGGAGYRLMLEILIERGPKARIVTLRLDIRRTATPTGPEEWRIVGQERLSQVEGLYRLALHADKQFTAKNLTVTSEDLTMHLTEGSVFVAEADGLPTAIVLRGRGRVRFHPAPAAERSQVKIYSGAEALETDFDAAYVRIAPAEFDARVDKAALTPRAVDRREWSKADEIFHEYIDLSYALDLNELSPDTWSLTPSYGDFLAEIRTRRFGSLTYARSVGEAEDITLFDRRLRKNIAVYASQGKLASRGPFYDEDELADYDITNFDIETSFSPDREWIDGRTRFTLRVRSHAMATVSIKLAETLTVRSLVSDELGRLMHLRVRGQNTVIVSLPSTLARNDTLTLTAIYSGRLPAQALDREALQVVEPPRASFQEDVIVQAEARYIYSSRSYWYPQAPVSDYATARLQLLVPAGYAVVASGEADETPVTAPAGKRQFTFVATRPVRYLACVISRFNRVYAASIVIPPSTGATYGGAADRGPAGSPPAHVGEAYDRVKLAVETNPRQQARGRDLSARVSELVKFYGAFVGDVPYPSFTLALTESQTPGGHSPAYFAVLNHPLPTSPYAWRNDPVSFEGYNDFYIAHEIAHQWWGQAVGWKNYHEQWLSEGFAQYFATLYAEQTRGPELLASILRHMRRWALSSSKHGPVYLGYRLGHIQSDGRIFRAIIYNKGAMVLHMLRRLIGDEPFFRGVRNFYWASRFRKAGTNDMRKAFEDASSRSLQRFFDRWVFDSTLPSVRVTTQVMKAGAASDAPILDSGDDRTPTGEFLLVRFDQGERVFDLPVTVSVQYADGRTSDVIVPVTDLIVERRIPLTGVFRTVEVNRDHAALAEFIR